MGEVPLASKHQARPYRVKQMRRVTLSLTRSRHHSPRVLPRPAKCQSLPQPSTTFTTPVRNLAQVRTDMEIRSETWFTPSGPRGQDVRDKNKSNLEDTTDERTLKLGQSMYTLTANCKRWLTHIALRILQSRLPTLLASPLPSDVLSPHISLHLFPSTHPHLPTVSGRVPYHAALWTAPMAWGRVPIVGNVKLIILSERVAKSGPQSHISSKASVGSERLIVRWKTCGKTKGKGVGAFYRGIGGSEQVDKITEWLGGYGRDDQEFCGLFIFEFDEEGRILTHTIEHAEENAHWDRASRVVSITDWLLSRVNGRRKEPELALSYVQERQRLQYRRLKEP